MQACISSSSVKSFELVRKQVALESTREDIVVLQTPMLGTWFHVTHAQERKQFYKSSGGGIGPQGCEALKVANMLPLIDVADMHECRDIDTASATLVHAWRSAESYINLTGKLTSQGTAIDKDVSTKDCHAQPHSTGKSAQILTVQPYFTWGVSLKGCHTPTLKRDVIITRSCHRRQTQHEELPRAQLLERKVGTEG